jgi:hypothetical protein
MGSCLTPARAIIPYLLTHAVGEHIESPVSTKVVRGNGDGEGVEAIAAAQADDIGTEEVGVPTANRHKPPTIIVLDKDTGWPVGNTSSVRRFSAWRAGEQLDAA